MGGQHEFLQAKHEYLPRQVYSTTATDWQARVDFDRMRKDRLARARQQMTAHDLGASVLFTGENIRYTTSVFQGNWKNNIFIRYAVVTRNRPPVLFETVGSDMVCAQLDAPWLETEVRPAMTWKWAEGAEEEMAGRMARASMTCSKRPRSRRSASGSMSWTFAPTKRLPIRN